jgi:predicted nuclease with TOPRIM domain
MSLRDASVFFEEGTRVLSTALTEWADWAADMQARSEVLTEENQALRTRLEQAEADSSALRARVDQLEARVYQLEADNSVMREHLDKMWSMEARMTAVEKMKDEKGKRLQALEEVVLPKKKRGSAGEH